MLACTLTLSCGGGGGDSKPTIVNLGDRDDGGSVQLKNGGRLVVTLSSNPTTGYAWAATQFAPALSQDGEPQYKATTGSPVAGRGGVQTFAFVAHQAGTQTLQLVYRRAFDPPSTPPAQTFTATIVVK